MQLEITDERITGGLYETFAIVLSALVYGRPAFTSSKTITGMSI
jgi:hypothetical protein